MRRSLAIKRRRIIRIGRIRPILHNIPLHLRQLVPNTAERLMHVQPHLFVPLRGAPDGRLGDMVPAHAVPQHHVQRRRRAALLAVRRDAHPAQTRSPEQQAFDLVAVAVVVEVDGAVGREEGVEVFVRESVGVSAFVLEDQEVRDVDDADAEAGGQSAQHGCRFDDFEGEFGADADEHDVGVQTVGGAGEFPDGGACAAMTVGFFWGEEDGLGLLGADH